MGRNIEILVCFICMGTEDRTLIDINNHYQITMNQHKNGTKKLNINVYNITFLLYQLLIILSLFIVYLFRQRDYKQNLYPWAACDYFLFHAAGE